MLTDFRSIQTGSGCQQIENSLFILVYCIISKVQFQENVCKNKTILHSVFDNAKLIVFRTHRRKSLVPTGIIINSLSIILGGIAGGLFGGLSQRRFQGKS